VSHAHLGLGSNLGDRFAHLQQALELLRRVGEITSVSPLYETDPTGHLQQPRFLNAACTLRTIQPPDDLLRSLKQIEIEIGRTKSFLNGPREIDIDILLYDRIVFVTPELIIPHPRLNERAFALVPLSAIAPDEIHPVTGKTISHLAAQADKKGIELSALTLTSHGG
jgi:2-amino-4-hydroxy-6-hydroxymethyldihydropteridine diphosphokinase